MFTAPVANSRKSLWYPPAILLLAIAWSTACADGATITSSEAINHVGETATVCGRVVTAKFAAQARGQPTFLNLDRPYPNHVFTAVIWGTDRAAFTRPPESLEGHKICVTGEIKLYREKAEIAVTSPSQIRQMP